jgi:hypothetical protein
MYKEHFKANIFKKINSWTSRKISSSSLSSLGSQKSGGDISSTGSVHSERMQNIQLSLTKDRLCNSKYSESIQNTPLNIPKDSSHEYVCSEVLQCKQLNISNSDPVTSLKPRSSLHVIASSTINLSCAPFEVAEYPEEFADMFEELEYEFDLVPLKFEAWKGT